MKITEKTHMTSHRNNTLKTHGLASNFDRFSDFNVFFFKNFHGFDRFSDFNVFFFRSFYGFDRFSDFNVFFYFWVV